LFVLVIDDYDFNNENGRPNQKLFLMQKIQKHVHTPMSIHILFFSDGVKKENFESFLCCF